MSDIQPRSRSGEKHSSAKSEATTPATTNAGLARSGWRLSQLISVALVAVALSYFAMDQRKDAKGVEGPYALCSTEGKQIYTVDADNSRVECVVVNGAHIVDTGSLRA